MWAEFQWAPLKIYLRGVNCCDWFNLSFRKLHQTGQCSRPRVFTVFSAPSLPFGLSSSPPLPPSPSVLFSYFDIRTSFLELCLQEPRDELWRGWHGVFHAAFCRHNLYCFFYPLLRWAWSKILTSYILLTGQRWQANVSLRHGTGNYLERWGKLFVDAVLELEFLIHFFLLFLFSIL